MKGEITQVIQADVSDKHVLKSIGMSDFDIGIVTMRDAVLANILCTSQMKSLGVNEVISRASSDIHGKILEEIGADKVIFPERGIGQRLSQFFTAGSTDVLDYVNFTSYESLMTSKHSLIEIKVPEFMIGKSLKELQLRTKYGVTVIAIRNDEINYEPDADRKFKEGEKILVFGKNDKLNKLSS